MCKSTTAGAEHRVKYVKAAAAALCRLHWSSKKKIERYVLRIRFCVCSRVGDWFIEMSTKGLKIRFCTSFPPVVLAAAHTHTHTHTHAHPSYTYVKTFEWFTQNGDVSIFCTKKSARTTFFNNRIYVPKLLELSSVESTIPMDDDGADRENVFVMTFYRIFRNRKECKPSIFVLFLRPAFIVFKHVVVTPVYSTDGCACSRQMGVCY